MAKKKKNNSKKQKINKELNEFIKKNKNQILTRGKEDLGADLSDKTIIKLFKANFAERMEGKKESLTEARKAMKKTLHTETFTGKKQIEFENVRESLIENKEWETFRKLNRHQKVDIEKFTPTKAPTGSNIRKRWLYQSTSSKSIYIDLLYNPDGSYAWSVHV